MYIDFHVHVLPDLDDGSKNVWQSIEMLKLSGAAGIRTVVATPHFRPWETQVADFLRKRKKAKQTLESAVAKTAANQDIPKLLCGAECSYIKGMSRYPRLEELCLEGTNYLLLELPNGKWSDEMFEELYRLNMHRGLRLMIAHPNRYEQEIRRLDAIGIFFEIDCLFQLNAGPLARWVKRKWNLSLLSSPVPCVLGSDMHSEMPEEQSIRQAGEIIERKLGLKIPDRIQRVSRAVLHNETPVRIKEMWKTHGQAL